VTLFRKTVAIGALCPVLLCAQNVGSLSGRVTNSVTGAGIQGVNVHVCPSAEQRPQCDQTVTDIAGAFHFAGLPNGEYQIINVGPKNGFTPIRTSTTGTFPTVTVFGDSRLNFQMTPYASVRGRVFDPQGNPAAGVTVKLGFFPEKVTGENGEFVFEAVPPNNRLRLSASPKTEPPAPDGSRPVVTYYPGVVDSQQAVLITTTGVDASYDIRLRAAIARAVRGVVIGPDGTPAPQARPAPLAQLTITRTEPGMVASVRGDLSGLHRRKQVEAAPAAVASPDGTFAFPPVIEGEWVIRASLLSQGKILRGTTALTVSTRDPAAGDIENIEIHLAPPFEVEVTADWQGAPPPPQTQPIFEFVGFLPMDSQDDLLYVTSPTAEPDKPQRFQLSGGRYFIGEGKTKPQFLPARGFYAAAAMLGNRDVLGQVVELIGPASLKMIYKTGGGTVRGTVEKGANAVVVLMADQTLEARLGYSGRCDANGTFSIPDLPPGEYTAVAVEGPYAGDPLRPEFMSALARDGKRVKVEAGVTVQVELRVAR